MLKYYTEKEYNMKKYMLIYLNFSIDGELTHEAIENSTEYRIGFVVLDPTTITLTNIIRKFS